MKHQHLAANGWKAHQRRRHQSKAEKCGIISKIIKYQRKRKKQKIMWRKEEMAQAASK